MQWIKNKFNELISDFYTVLKSIRIWINTSVVTVAMYLPDVILALPQLEQYVSVPDYKMWMGGLLAINILLSVRTTGKSRQGKK